MNCQSNSPWNKRSVALLHLGDTPSRSLWRSPLVSSRLPCHTTRLWLLPVAVLMASAAVAGAAPADAASYAEGVNRLGWDLVRASGEGDAILSPVSVWEALAMTHAGAAGETASEIAAVLGMPDDRGEIAAAAEAIHAAAAEARGEKITLEIANRLWLQREKKLAESFTKLLADRYEAPAGLVDFSRAPEAARDDINAWVADHTGKRITNLLPSGSITPMTRLVLTNAIYMKAAWADPFEESATRDEPFTLAGGGKAEVPFMHRGGRLAAGRVGEAQAAAVACRIPYAGGRLEMVLLVPEQADGLAAVLDSLDGSWLATLAKGGVSRPRPVRLALPKWKARKPLSLKPALAALGMKQAFAMGRADFSGIDGTRDLYVSQVVHEGFVEVSEEGTEAAAATGVVVATRAAIRPEEPLEIRADRPFVWAVVERQTGTMLFAAVVADPRD